MTHTGSQTWKFMEQGPYRKQTFDGIMLTKMDKIFHQELIKARFSGDEFVPSRFVDYSQVCCVDRTPDVGDTSSPKDQEDE